MKFWRCHILVSNTVVWHVLSCNSIAEIKCNGNFYFLKLLQIIILEPLKKSCFVTGWMVIHLCADNVRRHLACNCCQSSKNTVQNKFHSDFPTKKDVLSSQTNHTSSKWTAHGCNCTGQDHQWRHFFYTCCQKYSRLRCLFRVKGLVICVQSHGYLRTCSTD